MSRTPAGPPRRAGASAPAPGANHHPAIDQPCGWRIRKCVDDDLERRLVGDVANALAIKKFGQDSEIMGLAEEIHSARALHVAVRRHEIRQTRQGDNRLTPRPPAGSSWKKRAKRLCIGLAQRPRSLACLHLLQKVRGCSERMSTQASEDGSAFITGWERERSEATSALARQFLVNGITVNKITQTLGSAPFPGAFASILPSSEENRFALGGPAFLARRYVCSRREA